MEFQFRAGDKRSGDERDLSPPPPMDRAPESESAGTYAPPAVDGASAGIEPGYISRIILPRGGSSLFVFSLGAKSATSRDATARTRQRFRSHARRCPIWTRCSDRRPRSGFGSGSCARRRRNGWRSRSRSAVSSCRRASRCSRPGSSSRRPPLLVPRGR